MQNSRPETAVGLTGLRGPHNQIVDQLLERLERIKSGDSATERIVLLIGESGCGKTAVVRELFERMRQAASKGSEEYWPPTDEHMNDLSEVVPHDPLYHRKTVTPDPRTFIWHRDALPHFAWWGFNCTRDERPGHIILSAKEQLEAHYLPLRYAWAASVGALSRIQRSLKGISWWQAAQGELNTVADNLGANVTDELLSHLGLLEIGIPGLGTLASIGWKGIKTLDKAAEKHKMFHSEFDIGNDLEKRTQATIRELATLLTANCNDALPVVIAIEDIHLMGSSFIEFLESDALQKKGRPVLIVGTCWSEALDEHPGAKETPFQKWRRETVMPMAEASIVNLPTHELSQLVARSAPNTPRPIALEVARHWRNPYHLLLWLSLRSVQTEIWENDGSVASSRLRMPRGLTALMHERFAELHESTREALMFVCAAINPAPGTDLVFVPSLLTSPRPDQLRPAIQSEQEFLGALQNAVKVAWCLQDGEVMRLREPLLVDSLLSELQERYTERQLADMSNSYRASLSRWIDERTGNELRLPRSKLVDIVTADLVRLSRGDSTPSTAAAAAYLYAAYHLSDTAIDGLDYAPVAARHAVGSLGARHPDVFFARVSEAVWHLRRGRAYTARTLLANIVSDQKHSLGRLSHQVLETRHMLCAVLLEQGEAEDALIELGSLIEDTAAVPDETRIWLRSRGTMAVCLGELGRLDEAIEAAEQLAEDEKMLLDGNDPESLRTLANLATWRSVTLSPEDALIEAQGLFDEHVRLLGTNHYATHLANLLVCSAMVRAGRHREALPRSYQVWVSLAGALGNLHPRALEAREFIAEIQWALGRLSEAEIEMHSVLVFEEMSLGVFHDVTRRTRRTFGLFLRDANRTESYVSENVRCIVDARQPLEWTQLIALEGRALLLVEVRAERALHLYSQVVDLFISTLGLTDPETLHIRMRFAIIATELGDWRAALPVYARLLDDQVKVLGPHHHDVESTRQAMSRLKASLYLR